MFGLTVKDLGSLTSKYVETIGDIVAPVLEDDEDENEVAQFKHGEGRACMANKEDDNNLVGDGYNDDRYNPLVVPVVYNSNRNLNHEEIEGKAKQGGGEGIRVMNDINVMDSSREVVDSSPAVVASLEARIRSLTDDISLQSKSIDSYKSMIRDAEGNASRVTEDLDNVTRENEILALRIRELEGSAEFEREGRLGAEEKVRGWGVMRELPERAVASCLMLLLLYHDKLTPPPTRPTCSFLKW